MTELEGPPVVFGEVLFDQFEDGSAVLGGAPFNVAWHLQGFGAQPLFISRVGDDALGAEVRRVMGEWGMDTRGVQADGAHPTGTVQVRLAHGQPSYEIVADQAYDFIDPDTALAVARKAQGALLCHGSLAARNPASRAALEGLRGSAGLPAFVDINLREPWWTAQRTDSLLAGARWVKLNGDELALALGRGPIGGDELLDEAQRLRAAYDLHFVLVTLGERGAALVSDEGAHFAEPAKIDHFVDAVGAGDAFTSVVVLGLLWRWAPVTLLERAVSFAAALCQVRGATTSDRDLYRRYLDDWVA